MLSVEVVDMVEETERLQAEDRKVRNLVLAEKFV